MSKSVIRVAVTGGSGQIAYSLLFRIASGELFGKSQKVALHILELEPAMKALQGVVLELEDCGFETLHEIKIGSNPKEVFEGVDYALLVGAKPRGPGMERKDLLLENGKIFVEMGKALNTSASKDVKVLVVGNPCNTNCLITMHHAPDIPRAHFHAMTRLDQNRARFQLAQKASVEISEVSDIIIWGNHSATQVPDFCNAKIGEKKAVDKITDRSWLENDFFATVQKRGAAIIAARGKSSAASAANAILDAVKSIASEGDVFSSAICSDGNPYGISEGLIFSFPCKRKGNGEIEIVSSFTFDAFIKEKIANTEKELLQEKEMVAHLLT